MVWAEQDGWVLIVRATKKLLRLTGPSTALDDDRGTTLLGPWYVTVMFWRPAGRAGQRVDAAADVVAVGTRLDPDRQDR
jgi:hypothetical protein